MSLEPSRRLEEHAFPPIAPWRLRHPNAYRLEDGLGCVQEEMRPRNNARAVAVDVERPLSNGIGALLHCRSRSGPALPGGAGFPAVSPGTVQDDALLRSSSLRTWSPRLAIRPSARAGSPGRGRYLAAGFWGLSAARALETN